MASPNELIAAAVAQAHYQDIVHVCTTSAEGCDDVNDNGYTHREQHQEIHLTAQLDEENGGIRWMQLRPTTAISLEDRSGETENDDDSFTKESNETAALSKLLARRHLQTKPWIFAMLNDHRRNELYQKAIERAVRVLLQQQRAKQLEPRQQRLYVLDIGSGTGLLAMMAARALQTAGCNNEAFHIYSIEMSSAMADIARHVVESNGLQDCISVCTGHSTLWESKSLEDDNNNIQEISNHEGTHIRFHLCVSELLESGLLGEGLLPSLRDAWQRLLQPKAIVLPQRARVFAAAVQGTEQQRLNVFYGPLSSHQNQDNGSTTSLNLALDTSGSLFLDAGAATLSIHGEKLIKDGSIKMLTAPAQILNISLKHDTMMTRMTGDETAPSETLVKVIENGQIEAILVWWELDLWTDESSNDNDGLVYSMRPGAEPWQDHWHQCLHSIPTDQQYTVQVNEMVTLQSSHTDAQLKVSVHSKQQGTTEEVRKRQRTENVPNTVISPQRAQQLNNEDRMNFYKRSIEYAIHEKGQSALLLDLSDFSLVSSLGALQYGAKNVVSIESGSLAMTSARMAQLANNLPLDQAKFEILQCHAESLSLELLGGAPAAIVVAEPYYQVLEGWHLQEALNFYNTIQALRSRGMIADDAISIPSKCRIMACGIQSSQLLHAYSMFAQPSESSSSTDNGLPLPNVCGFDHSIVVQIHGGFQHNDLSLPMWQYDHEESTPPTELAVLDYESPRHPNSSSIDSALDDFMKLQKDRCDAVMVWLEYVGYDCSNTLSTKADCYRQCVRMMASSPSKSSKL